MIFDLRVHHVDVDHRVVDPVVDLPPRVPRRDLIEGIEGPSIVVVSEGGELDDVDPGLDGERRHCGALFRGFIDKLDSGPWSRER